MKKRATFEEACAITAVDSSADGLTAEMLTCTSPCTGWTTWTAERVLERLTSLGVLEREERSTYCSECGSDSGVEYCYKITPKGAAVRSLDHSGEPSIDEEVMP